MHMKQHMGHHMKWQGRGKVRMALARIIGLFIAKPNYHKQAQAGRGASHNGGVKAAKVVAS